MGVVSPLGHELDVFYNSLLAGKSGISMIEVGSSIVHSIRQVMMQVMHASIAQASQQVLTGFPASSFKSYSAVDSFLNFFCVMIHHVCRTLTLET